MKIVLFDYVVEFVTNLIQFVSAEELTIPERINNIGRSDLIEIESDCLITVLGIFEQFL